MAELNTIFRKYKTADYNASTVRDALERQGIHLLSRPIAHFPFANIVGKRYCIPNDPTTRIFYDEVPNFEELAEVK
jgi:hypothetical protein